MPAIPFLDTVFPWIVVASLRASLLSIAVFALRCVVGRQLSAHYRYALWLPMVLVTVMPVLPASPWSAENGLAKLSANLPSATLRLLHTDLAAAITNRSAVSSALHMHPWLSSGWLLVTSTLIVAAGIGYQQAFALIIRGSAMASPEILGDIVAEARRIHLRRLPRVIVSTAVESPAVTGLFRPALLLPADFPAGLTRTEARLILLHELTHLKRSDLLCNWFLCVLQALHWFNPLLWLALGRIRADRESVCDERVLSVHKEDLRADYASALLKLHQTAPTLGLSLAFGGLTPVTLRGRLLSIARHRRIHFAWSIVGAGMVAGLLVAGTTRAPLDEGTAANVETKESVRAGRLVKEFADLPPPIGKAGTDVLSAEQPRRLFGTDMFIKETLSERFHGNALPEWWPMINSARILFHPIPPAKPQAPSRSIRRFT